MKLPWYLGETFNAAIGQGYVAVTPIQMAYLMATIANGGDIYQLSLLKGNKKIIGKAALKPETLQLLKEALAGVVNEPGGTAYGSKSQMTVMGGKTGTAQVVGKKKGGAAQRFGDHAWFVALAPVDNPEIAVSVFVEHGGHGATAAAPIAKKAIEAYIASQKAAGEGTGQVVRQKTEKAFPSGPLNN